MSPANPLPDRLLVMGSEKGVTDACSWLMEHKHVSQEHDKVPQRDSIDLTWPARELLDGSRVSDGFVEMLRSSLYPDGQVDDNEIDENDDTAVPMLAERILGTAEEVERRNITRDDTLALLDDETKDRILAVGQSMVDTSEIYVAECYIAEEKTLSEVLIEIGENLAELPAAMLFEPAMLVGDQHCISGSPASGPASNKVGLTKQWAWGCTDHGIRLCKAPDSQGSGIKIVIFDSSPFDVASLGVSEQPILPGGEQWLDVVHPHIVAQGAVHNPVAFPHHGLCVASLAHTVAPNATIELVRSLNMFVEGDSLSLGWQLLKRAVDAVKADGGDMPQVFNLSLHVRPKEKKSLSLWLLLITAYAACCGNVVVAAAGNDSPAGGEAKKSSFPASLPWVAGIAASGRDPARAWFSHKGDSMAPGCCLTAMVNEFPPLSPGYNVVSGTSYSAGIASGVAALRLSKTMAAEAGASPLVTKILKSAGTTLKFAFEKGKLLDVEEFCK